MTELSPQMIATIGIFLTLTGLLGTFFYVHLSNWVRDLLALETKWRFNRLSSTDEAERACRECRYALPGLHNNIPLLMAAGISAFVLLSAGMAIVIVLPLVRASQLAACLLIALVAFLIIYVSFVIYLLWRGYAIGQQLQTEIDRKFAAPAAAPPKTVTAAGVVGRSRRASGRSG